MIGLKMLSAYHEIRIISFLSYLTLRNHDAMMSVGGYGGYDGAIRGYVNNRNNINFSKFIVCKKKLPKYNKIY